MTVLPQDVVANLRQRVAELEQALQSTSAERDAATARLRVAADRQAASAEILRTIGGVSGNAERSLHEIAETTRRLFEASSVSIFVADGDEWGQIIHAGAGSRRIGTEVPVAQLRIGGRSMPGAAFAENRQIHVPDLDHVDPAIADWPGLAPARAAGSRTISGTPLRRAGHAIGVLIVHRDRPAPFTAEELALLQNFADQAAIAIENARLFNEVQARTQDLTEALERQTATSDVLAVISRSPSDLLPVLTAISDTAARLCGSEMTMFFRFDGTVFRILASWNFPPDVREMLERRPIAPGHPSALGRAGATLKPVYIPDVLADPNYGLTNEQSRARYRTTLGVPLLRDGRLIGALSLNRSEPGSFTEKHAAIVETFADQAVIAIENVRLFDEVQAKTRDLSEALQQQTATADVLKVISRSAFDLDTVLNTLIQSGAKLCEALTGVIWLRRGELLHLAAHVGYSREWVEAAYDNPIKPDPESQTMSGRVAATGEYIHLEDILADDRFKSNDFHRIGQYRACLMVPLIRDGKVEGTIGFTRFTPALFGQRQIELVQTFADQAVIAIENARLFDEVQARTRELAASLDELRTAQDRLVQTEKLASLGQLTAGIAHEIKNPLNFVNNFSALSAELTDELNDVLKSATLAGNIRAEVDELTGLLKDNLQKVVQHGKRADSIVKNMLQHSREGSGEHRAADINAIVDESLNLAYHGARAEKAGFNIALQRDLDPSVGMAEVFPQEITRVLLNLISNGFYAATRRKLEAGDGFEPVLSAATKNLGDRVEIRIRDNGTGIPEDVREKIFNPFFTTKPTGEGTGLGLSMSHDIIVKQHGGSIDVDTEPGFFTEFRIVLPKTSQG